VSTLGGMGRKRGGGGRGGGGRRVPVGLRPELVVPEVIVLLVLFWLFGGRYMLRSNSFASCPGFNSL
jgi:hypothetical protein